METANYPQQKKKKKNINIYAQFLFEPTLNSFTLLSRTIRKPRTAIKFKCGFRVEATRIFPHSTQISL